MPVARRQVGVAALDQGLQGVVAPGIGSMLLAQQASELGLLAGGLLVQELLLGFEGDQFGLRLGAAVAEFLEAAVGGGDGRLGLAQLVGNGTARAFALRQIVAQVFDAFANVLEFGLLRLALFPGRCGRRCGVRGQRQPGRQQGNKRAATSPCPDWRRPPWPP